MSVETLHRRVFISHAWPLAGDTQGQTDHQALGNFLQAVEIDASVPKQTWVPLPKLLTLSDGRSIQLSIFFDQHALHPMADLTPSLREALSQSHLLAACWSERYPTRAACMWEYVSAFFAGADRGRLGERVRVMPVDLGRVEASLRPSLAAQNRLLPDLTTEEPLEIWQDLAEIIAVFSKPIGPLKNRIANAIAWTPLTFTKFVGREAELWTIYEALHAPGNAGSAQVNGAGGAAEGPGQGVVKGLGGIGKSMLVQVYAHRFSGAYPGGVFWINAYGHDDAKRGRISLDRLGERRRQYWDLANLLGVNLPGNADGAKVRLLLGETLKERGPYLWIVDDYPSTPLAEERVEDWLAPSPNGKSLITSRCQIAMNLGTEIPLGVLTPQAAFELLTSDFYPGEGEKECAEKVCRLLGFHPLALAIAGAGMGKGLSPTPYRNFVEKLELANKGTLLHDSAEFLPELPTGHEKSIVFTLKSNIDNLSEGARTLLKVASVLAQAPIPGVLLAKVFEGLGRDADTALRQLGKAGLVEVEHPKEAGEDVMVRVHTLVAHCAVVGVGENELGEARKATQRVILLHLAEGANDARNGRQLLPWLVHGHVLVDDTEDGLNLLSWLGRVEQQRGDYRSAEEICRAEWDRREGKCGPDHGSTLVSRGNLALALFAHGELEKAKEHQEVLWVIRTALFGEEHPESLTSRGNLALTLFAQGAVQEARHHQEVVWEISQRVLGPEHQTTLISRGNLAWTLFAQGDLEGAMRHQVAVWADNKKLLGEDHPDSLRNQINLSLTLFAQGDLDSAKGHQLVGWETSSRLLGEEHPNTLTARGNLGLTLSRLGDLDEAKLHLSAVWKVSKKRLGKRHPIATLAAWNFFLTLTRLKHPMGKKVYREDLAWLASAPDETLSHQQREIKATVAEMIAAAAKKRAERTKLV